VTAAVISESTARFCETEVEHLHAPIRRDDDVVAFQITMDDAALVRVGERIGELTPVVHDLLDWQRTGVQHRAERASFDQLHRDVSLAVGFSDLVYRADIWMVERGCRTRFTHQSGARGGIMEARSGEHFDGDVAIQLLVAGAIHLAHATSPEPADDAVVCQPPAIHLGIRAAFYPSATVRCRKGTAPGRFATPIKQQPLINRSSR
jgi:hypothetical protein